MKSYIQPKVDYITLEVKNDVCLSFGVDPVSAGPQPVGLMIGSSSVVTSD